MLKYPLILYGFLFLNLNLFAQSGNIAFNNAIHFDLASGKFIGMYALNFEKNVLQLNSFKMNANAGAGAWYLSTISNWYSGKSISLSLNNLVGKKQDFFEFDLGIRYTAFNKKSDKDISPFFPIVNLGFRHQKPKGKGLIFRTYIGLSGIGLGIGKAF